ncbi:hypothetical protein TraAM80_06195, partial [Trypanosoma rangeli]
MISFTVLPGARSLLEDFLMRPRQPSARDGRHSEGVSRAAPPARVRWGQAERPKNSAAARRQLLRIHEVSSQRAVETNEGRSQPGKREMQMRSLPVPKE